jgi:hypothetical protein
MPKVGKRSFSYSKAGKAAAKSYAKKTGAPMRTKRAGLGGGEPKGGGGIR